MSEYEFYVWDYNLGADDNSNDSPDSNFIEANLNLPGGDGWELVAVVPYNNSGSRYTSGFLHYFKRLRDKSAK